MRRRNCEPSGMMNQRSWILAITAALALAAGCKKDQPAAPASSDDTAKQGVKPGPADPAQAGMGSDGRGRRGRNAGPMTDEERAAMMKQRAEALHKRLDTDGDGKLTPAELTAGGGGRMRFDDPAALDTNHDGDISADELAAAMKARFDQRRAQRAGSGSADGSGGEDGTGGGEGSGGW
jgi:EF hand domain-containing protein